MTYVGIHIWQYTYMPRFTLVIRQFVFQKIGKGGKYLLNICLLSFRCCWLVGRPYTCLYVLLIFKTVCCRSQGYTKRKWSERYKSSLKQMKPIRNKSK